MENIEKFRNKLEKINDECFELSDLWDKLSDENCKDVLEGYPLSIPWHEFAWCLSRWYGKLYEKL